MPNTLDSERVAALAGQIEQIIQKRIAENKLELPLMPTVARRAMALIREADYSLKRVARLIEQDPLLATRTVRLANSVLYGSAGVVIRGVEGAVTRLGTEKVRAVLVESSMRHVFTSRDPAIAYANEAIWQHSVAVALVARDLGALSSSDEADTCYLCGLLHDVGKPLVAAMLLEAERLAGERRATFLHSETWIEAVRRVHQPVGVALAETWKLPAEIAATIRQLGEYDMERRQSPANYVRFANAAVKRAGFSVGAADLEAVDALITIGRSVLGLDDEIVARVVSDLPERVKAHLD